MGGEGVVSIGVLNMCIYIYVYFVCVCNYGVHDFTGNPTESFLKHFF